MTTKQYHPPIYYTVRSAVRWVFWTGVAFLVVLGFGKLVKASEHQKPACRVNLNLNFTWSPIDSVDLDKCQHPRNVVLHEGGTWEWKD